MLATGCIQSYVLTKSELCSTFYNQWNYDSWLNDGFKIGEFWFNDFMLVFLFALWCPCVLPSLEKIQKSRNGLKKSIKGHNFSAVIMLENEIIGLCAAFVFNQIIPALLKNFLSHLWEYDCKAVIVQFKIKLLNIDLCNAFSTWFSHIQAKFRLRFY